jgi:hypothetical protein
VKLTQLILGRQQAVHAGGVLKLVGLVVADGSRELLVVRIAGPHLGGGLLGELLAALVPLAEVLDGVGADLDGDLGQDGGALDGRDADDRHDGGDALLEGLGGLFLGRGLDGELAVGSLGGNIVSMCVCVFADGWTTSIAGRTGENTFWPVSSVVVEGGMLALGGAVSDWGAGAARTEAQRASWTMVERVNFMVNECGEEEEDYFVKSVR